MFKSLSQSLEDDEAELFMRTMMDEANLVIQVTFVPEPSIDFFGHK